MDVCVYVLAVNGQCGGVALGAAQCGVQHGAVLGDVNVLAGEHCLASLLQLDLFSELEQQLNGLGSNQVLGEVDVQFVGGEAELLRAFRVSGKPFAQVRSEGLVMSGQSRPRGGGRRVNRSSHGSILLFSGASVISFEGDMGRYGEKIETWHCCERRRNNVGNSKKSKRMMCLVWVHIHGESDRIAGRMGESPQSLKFRFKKR